MPTVYLKSGEIKQIKLEDLENYLYENKVLIKTFTRKLKRKPLN